MTPAQQTALTTWASRLYPYQRAWIAEPARFAAWDKSRQIGGSHANAGGAVVGALVEGRPQIVLSASQSLSDEVLDKARAHARVLATLGYAGADRFTVDSATELAWSPRARIVALPANPRTARSFSGDLWLDEAAYFQDAEGIRDAAFPIAMRGGWRVRAISTPNGAVGFWHRLVTQTPAGWALHRTTIDDAIAAGLRVALADLWALCGGDERLFAQWFRCAFLDGDLQYIPTALADLARGWTGKIPNLADAEWHAGLDIGRTRDVSALAIVAVLAGVAWVVQVLTWPRTKFRLQKAALRKAREVFRWQTLHVDQTGLGMQLAEELVDEFGPAEVRPVQFTEDAKDDLATRTLRWHRDGRVRYPRGKLGATLRDQAISLRRVVTASANVVYRFPRDAGGHADEFTALMLALKGAGEPPIPRGSGAEPLFAVA